MEEEEEEEEEEGDLALVQVVEEDVAEVVDVVVDEVPASTRIRRRA